MRAALIRLTNVALFTMACWLVSVVFNEILAERLQPHTISAYGGELHAAGSAPAWDERKVIIDRNLFGAKVARSQPKPPPPPVVEEPEEVEETTLPLELLGTLWSSDSNLSTAAIRDTANRTEQVVAVGEPLEERDQVTVVAIERGRVILQNGSRREELLLSEEEAPPSADTASRESPSRARRPGAPPSRSSVASAGSSRPSRSPVVSSADGLSSPAAKRRAERKSRADAKAKKRAMTGKARMAEANKLATGRERTSKASPTQQQEAKEVMKSLIESGASPDEITKRMQELETQHRGAE